MLNLSVAQDFSEKNVWKAVTGKANPIIRQGVSFYFKEATSLPLEWISK